MNKYSNDSGVLIASAKCQLVDGKPGSGGPLCDKLHQRMVSVPQGCDGVPCLGYGDPKALFSYRGGTDLATLSAFVENNRKPPSPSPPPTPSPPPPAPPAPAGDYLVAESSYVCPPGYGSIVDKTECHTAVVAAAGAKDWMAVEAESDNADPSGCWAYGESGSYSNFYMNAVGTSKNTRPQRNKVCKQLPTFFYNACKQLQALAFV
eukprot:TRINITY_DN38136_c0_g1_i1.p1 TRINITY_DN38136_c0_g1~~TRINITY_DN38136_c0_g1_i1.p1  ORF type:complete len:206 (-),score=10.59 TRINITY_DN38136_c0_g1_i1:226-843(-)